MLKNRKFNVILVSPDHAVGYSRDAKGMEVAYDGKKTEVKL